MKFRGSKIGTDVEALTDKTVNPVAFQFIKKFAESQEPKNKNVILIFDEICCKNVNPSEFNNSGAGEKKPMYCIVFAIRSINEFWYLPIGSVFWYRNSCANLADCIRVFIHAVYRNGLTTVCSICPPNQYLMGAVEYLINVKNLKQKTNAHVYSVGSITNIVHIYDPPSLLKSMRNEFIYNDMKFTDSGDCYEASFDKIRDSYEKPNKIKGRSITVTTQMCTTNLAARTFSETTYNVLKTATENGKASESGTPEFCLFMDKLFDTFNGHPKNKKVARKALTRNSVHYGIWTKAIRVFKTMRATPKQIVFTPLKNAEKIKNISDKRPSRRFNTVQREKCKSVSTNSYTIRKKDRNSKKFGILNKKMRFSCILVVKHRNLLFRRRFHADSSDARVLSVNWPQIFTSGKKCECTPRKVDETDEKEYTTDVDPEYGKDVEAYQADLQNTIKLCQLLKFLTLLTERRSNAKNKADNNKKSGGTSVVCDRKGDAGESKRFVEKSCFELGKQLYPPVAYEWIVTINGMKKISQILHKRDFKQIRTKSFNVDPIHEYLHYIVTKKNKIRGVDKFVEEGNSVLLDETIALCAFKPLRGSILLQ